MDMAKYYELKDLESRAPKLFGIPTGTRLDEMFYKIEIENGKHVKKPLGGIPYLSVLNLTGVPDTGKSVLAEQFAITQANAGYKVLFVTVESPANFLYTALKHKAEVLGVDFKKIEQNIIVIDASENDELRENPKALIDTMAYAIREKKITNTIIDSITGLYEHKEVLARQIVRQFFNFLKKFRQTALLVSQKRSAQASESAEAAGGLAVAHIVDGTIVLDKKIIETRWDVNLYGLPLGSVIRTIRIDGCRICGHDSRTWVFEITEMG
ncbi:MAG TPA: KaiC domain-containing protein, partial [Archaeoglobus profundus]|nr:KaiC domain-containing protein [Archaeoglobus profundus]